MNILPARIPSLVWCDHVINEFCLMSTPTYNYAIRSHNYRLGVDIRQNSPFIYLSHDHIPQEMEFMQAVYKMNSQQYCSLGNIHDGSADNSLKWVEVGDEV